MDFSRPEIFFFKFMDFSRFQGPMRTMLIRWLLLGQGNITIYYLLTNNIQYFDILLRYTIILSLSLIVFLYCAARVITITDET